MFVDLARAGSAGELWPGSSSFFNYVANNFLSFVVVAVFFVIVKGGLRGTMYVTLMVATVVNTPAPLA